MGGHGARSRSRGVDARRFVVAVVAFLSIARGAAAQEATFFGTVTDATGGVLPGVSIVALHEASGNVFSAVSDAKGSYRIAARVGRYKVTAELSGFGTVTRDAVELLVGQQMVVNLQLGVSTIEESITVTAEAPLVDVTQSKLGGNIDARQMQELPVNGRQWLDLTMLAPGSRVNAVNDAPTQQGGAGEQAFQLNLDGQQITSTLAGLGSWGQPRFSRDTIAEFEFVSNRFDATQGRSSGVQVNAVTKSGTNQFAGSLAGYFRDDSMNAADFIVDRVLKYSNQQLSGTVGGPIKRDRIHFFVGIEGEREPQSFTFTSPYQSFNVSDLTATRTETKGMGRADIHFDNARHLTIRGAGWTNDLPYDPRSTGGATLHASQSNFINWWSGQTFASFTQVFGGGVLNEVKGGWTRMYSKSDNVVPSVQVQLRGYTIGQQIHYPLILDQSTYSVRDDLSLSTGRHQVKIGGEFLRTASRLGWLVRQNGVLNATGGPVPANIEELFPVWDDPSTWNLTPLSPIVINYQQNFANSAYTEDGSPSFQDPRTIFAAWVQDDWSIASNLVVNLGVRWDVVKGALAESVEVPPFKPAVSTRYGNVAPRLGFAYSLDNARTVIRGGFGTFFADVTDQLTHFTKGNVSGAIATTLNDGRPNFASDPYNGRPPTYDSIIASGAVRDSSTAITSPELHFPYSYQTSIGVQRQLTSTTAVEADYVWQAGRRQQYTIPNINVSYNPATGLPNPFTDASLRPYPEWGIVQMNVDGAWSNYHALQTGLTKRFSNRWQASATYTLSRLKDGTPQPLLPGCEFPSSGPGSSACTTPVTVVPDLGGEYTLAANDQRHRAVVNGIVELPFGIHASGLYFYGSGQRFATSIGGDARRIGATSSRVASGLGAYGFQDGQVIPRNNFVGKPLHRVDLRFVKRVTLTSTVKIDGIVEVFNAFNHENYGSYVTSYSNPLFGQPTQNLNLAYQARMVQLGVRMMF